MITRTNQDWSKGSIVKVGFLKLIVVDARAEYDYMPDIYTLTSLDGQTKYEFIPHKGLFKLDAK